VKKSLLLAVLTLASFNSFADLFDTLLLQGTVNESTNIVVTPVTIASTLNLTASQTNLVVASVSEKSNSHTGYNVNISSAHAGNLLHEDAVEVFPYALKYDGASINLAAPVDVPYAIPSHGHSDRAVTISYVGVPEEDMVAGIYADIITFTISAI